MAVAQAQELEAQVPPSLRAQVFQKRVEINKYRSDLLREAATLRPQNPAAATYQLDVQLYLAAVSSIEQQVADYEYCAWSQLPELYDAHLKLQEAAKLRQSAQSSGALPPGADLLGLPQNLSMVHHPNFRPSASIIPSEAPDYISDSGSDDSFQSFYSAFTTQEDGQNRATQLQRMLSGGAVTGHGAPRPTPFPTRNSTSALSHTNFDGRNVWGKPTSAGQSPHPSPPTPASPATKYDSPITTQTPPMSPAGEREVKDSPNWTKGGRSPKPILKRNVSPLRQPGSPAQSVAFHTPPSSPLTHSPGKDTLSKATTSSRPTTPKSEMFTPQNSASLPEGPDCPSTSQQPQPIIPTPPPNTTTTIDPSAPSTTATSASSPSGPSNDAPTGSGKASEPADHAGGITLPVSSMPYVAATPRITSPPSRASSSGLSEPGKSSAPAPTVATNLSANVPKPKPSNAQVVSPPVEAAPVETAPIEALPQTAEQADAAAIEAVPVAAPDAGVQITAQDMQSIESGDMAAKVELTAVKVEDTPVKSHDAAVPTVVAAIEASENTQDVQDAVQAPSVQKAQEQAQEQAQSEPALKTQPKVDVVGSNVLAAAAVVPRKPDVLAEQATLRADEVSVPVTPTPSQPNTVGIVSPSSTITSTTAQDFSTSTEPNAPEPLPADSSAADSAADSGADSHVESEPTFRGESPVVEPVEQLMAPAERDAIAEQVVNERTTLTPLMPTAFGTPVTSLNLDDKQQVPNVLLLSKQTVEEEEEVMMPLHHERLHSVEIQGTAWDGASLVDGELLKKGLGPQLTSPTPSEESRSVSIAGWMAESSRVREVHTGKAAEAAAAPQPTGASTLKPTQAASEKLLSGTAMNGEPTNHLSSTKSTKSGIAAQLTANTAQSQRLPALEEDSVLSPAMAQESLLNRPHRLLTGNLPVSPTFSTNSFEIDRQDLMYSSSQQRAEAAAKVLKQFALAKRGAVMMMPQEVMQGMGAAGDAKEAGKADSSTDSDPAAGPSDTIQGPASPMYVHTIFWPDNADTPRTSMSVPPTEAAGAQKQAAAPRQPQATVEENLSSSSIQPESALPPQLANLDPTGLERYRLANGDQLLVVREKAPARHPAEASGSLAPNHDNETLTTIAESEPGDISDFLWDPNAQDPAAPSGVSGDGSHRGHVNTSVLYRQGSSMSQSESQSAASSRPGTGRVGAVSPQEHEDNIRLNGEELSIGSQVFRLNDANDVNMLFELLRNSLLGRSDESGYTPPDSAPGSAPVPLQLHQPNSAVSMPGSAPLPRNMRSLSLDRNTHVPSMHSMAAVKEPLANRLFAALTQASHNKQQAGAEAAGLPPPASNLLACLDEIVTPRNADGGHGEGHSWLTRELAGLPNPPPPIRVPGGPKIARSSSAPGYHPLMPPSHFPMPAPPPNRPTLRETYPMVNTMPVNQVPAVPMPAVQPLMPTTRSVSHSHHIDPRATLLSAAARTCEQSTGVAQSYLSHTSRIAEGLPPSGPLEVMRSSVSTTSTTMSSYMQRPQLSGASVSSQVSPYIPETPSTAPTKIVLRESKGRWRSKKYVWQLVVGGEQQQTGEMTAGSEVATSGPSMVASSGPPSLPDTATSGSNEFLPPHEVAADKKKKRVGGFKAAARLLKL